MVKVKLEKEQVLLQKHVNIEGMLMVSRGGGREGREGGGAAQTLQWRLNALCHCCCLYRGT